MREQTIEAFVKIYVFCAVGFQGGVRGVDSVIVRKVLQGNSSRFVKFE